MVSCTYLKYIDWKNFSLQFCNVPREILIWTTLQKQSRENNATKNHTRKHYRKNYFQVPVYRWGLTQENAKTLNFNELFSARIDWNLDLKIKEWCDMIRFFSGLGSKQIPLKNYFLKKSKTDKIGNFANIIRLQIQIMDSSFNQLWFL